MPHVNTKDTFKRLVEHSEKLGLTPKDKRSMLMQPIDLEVLNFEIDNPMPKYMLHLLFQKEAYFVCWKNGETEERPIEEILTEFVDFLSTPQPIEDNEDPDIKLPPIFKSFSLELTAKQYAELFDEDNDGDSIHKEQTDLTGIDDTSEKTEDLLETSSASKSSVQTVKINNKGSENNLEKKDSGIKVDVILPELKSKDKIASRESQKTLTNTVQLPANSKEAVKSRDSQKTLTNSVSSRNSKDKIKSKESQIEENKDSKEIVVRKSKESPDVCDAVPLVGGKSSKESHVSIITVIENVPPEGVSSNVREDDEENINVEDDVAKWKEEDEEKVKVIAPGNRVVIVPPLWTPINKRATAALIFLYFRTVRF